jgi:hypothetical protein
MGDLLDDGHELDPSRTEFAHEATDEIGARERSE